MALHIKHQHSNATQFVCHVCHKEIASQQETYTHWNKCHLTGQFQCNLNECAKVFDTRYKAHDHQRRKHCPESKRLKCTHVGCSSSFILKSDLERHEMTHLNRKPFQCSWLQCIYRSNQRAHLVRHIRVRHFGLPVTLKEQTAKNIVDHRDPNEYVQVVDEEDDK